MQENNGVIDENVPILNSEQLEQSTENGKNLKGIGGWLIFVGFGIVISPFRLLKQLVPYYHEMFTDGTYSILTSEQSSAYHPIWMPYLFGELFLNLITFIGSLALFYLFFAKKAYFPKLYIYLAVFHIIFIIVDALIPTLILPSLDFFDKDTVKELVKSSVIILIWVPYMKVSERVKLTFVK